MKKLLLVIVLIVCTLRTVHPQTIQITGTVTGSEDGTPLPGVTVVIKGTLTGTLTDANGKFSINAQSGQILVLSFVGYKTSETRIEDQPTLNVILEPDIIKMDEVLVVAYGTARRSSFTGSVQNVTSDKLATTVSESLDKALSGKATGVRVTSLTGDPGVSGDIQIRGIGSITGSTSPLYIVDGIPIITGQFGNTRISSNVLSAINPQDIESITVLKDAAAASLYGSRAANGVVIITTKRGGEGEVNFNLKANYGVSGIATDSYKQMSGPEYMEYEKAAILGYRLNQLNALVPGSLNYGNATVNQAALDWVEANYAGYTYVDDPNVDTDWWSAIYGQGSDQEYQLSASGGTAKSKFYASLGYKDVDGIVELYGYKRYTGTVNIDSKVNKWLDLSFNTMLSYSDQTGRMNQTDQVQGIATASPLSLIMQGNPTSKIYNEDGSLNLNASFNTRVKNSLYALQPEQAYTNNKTYRVITSGTASVRFTDFLSFKSTNAIDYFNLEGFRYWGPTSIDGESLNGLGERPNDNTSQITSSNILNFNDIFGHHSIGALVGFESQLYNNLNAFYSASNYSTDKLQELSVGQPRSVSSNVFKRYLQSLISNINYNYDDRYYLAASLRRDQSSQLGLNKRDAMFYSLSASWRFAKESFLKSDWLTDGKIRFSYGTNGNLPASSYEHLGLYNFGGIYGSESAIYLSQPENKNLGWEMSNNMNLGLDIGLFNKLSVSAEYFYKYTHNLLLDVPASYLTGFESALQNTGEISNKGIEAELHLADILSSDLKWNMDVTFSTLKSIVEKLPGGNDIIQGDGNHYIFRERESLYTFYLPVWYDVDPESGLARFVVNPALPAEGTNLTYFYANAQRGLVAKAYPDKMGSISNSLSYEGISLGILLTYQFGGNMFDYPGYFQKNHGVRFGSFNWAKEVAGNYWTKPGDIVKYPRPVAVWSGRPDRWSTMHILSTDYIRVKELVLSYRVPESLLSFTGFESNIMLSVSAGNLAFLYKAEKHIDPEVSLNGYRTVDTPPARTINFSINFNF